MMQNSLELHFSSTEQISLVRTVFNFGLNGQVFTAVRGKTPGAYGSCGTFQWSRAVQGLCLLLVRTVAGNPSASKDDPVMIDGRVGSLAASLNYALDKQPNWLMDMFGTDSSGKSNIRRILRRSNPSFKMGSKVALSINTRLLAGDRIKLFLEGQPCCPELIERVLTSIDVHSCPELEAPFNYDSSSLQL